MSVAEQRIIKAVADCRKFEHALRSWLKAKKSTSRYWEIDVDVVHAFICDNLEVLHDAFSDHLRDLQSSKGLEQTIFGWLRDEEENKTSCYRMNAEITADLICTHWDQLNRLFGGDYNDVSNLF